LSTLFDFKEPEPNKTDPPIVIEEKTDCKHKIPRKTMTVCGNISKPVVFCEGEELCKLKEMSQLESDNENGG
jgi:hypothetical protein